MPRYPVIHPQAHWSAVGVASDEVVVLRDLGPGDADAAARVHVVRGGLAVAWWARMDGQPGHDELSLVQEVACVIGYSTEVLEALFSRFVAVLTDQGLVVWQDHPVSRDRPRVHSVPPYPSIPSDVAAPDTWCIALDLEPLTSRDLVALGSFVGGTGNVSTVNACTSQTGAIGNATSGSWCRPGASYGYFNLGWQGVPCGS